MSKRLLALALASAAILAASVAVAQTAPPAPARLRNAPAAPQVEALLPLAPAELARGYLAAQAALPLVEQAGQGLGIVDIGIDGQKYRIDSANAGQFIPLFNGRIAAYAQAIGIRGAPAIDGQYTFAAGPACKGETFDPRRLFAAASAADGTPFLPTVARITQTGADTNLVLTFNRGRTVFTEILPGTSVENTIVFSNVENGVSIHGTVKDAGAIELKLDPEEVKTSPGVQSGSGADWQALAACLFTLTKR
jgi:hypothetical protein